MPVLHILPYGDGRWTDLDPERTTWLRDAGQLTVAGLSKGLQSGLPSVAIRIDLPDGSVVVAETTLRLFLTAADALKAVHGDPRHD